jgi:putative protease
LDERGGAFKFGQEKESMIFNTPVNNLQQVDLALKHGLKEFLLAPKLLSRFGKLELRETSEFAKSIKDRGGRVILEWDALFCQNQFKKVVDQLHDFEFFAFDEIRVQDPGVFQWVLDHTEQQIQLNLETGNHNFQAIQNWVNYKLSRISRVILSGELPGKVIAEYRKKLDVPFELMGIGRILLFYTPRGLLNPLTLQDQSYLEGTASSEESPHSGFQLLQNDHGTFMFNPKDQSLLDQIPQIQEAGVTHLRLDLRFADFENLFPMVMNSIETADSSLLKENWPVKFFSGFFRVNKTDVLFKKLKNRKIVREDENYLGVVLDVIKKETMGIKLKTCDLELSKGDVIEIHTPEGKIKKSLVDQLFNSKGEDIPKGLPGQIVFMKHIGGVSIRSSVYKSASQQA